MPKQHHKTGLALLCVCLSVVCIPRLATDWWRDVIYSVGTLTLHCSEDAREMQLLLLVRGRLSDQAAAVGWWSAPPPGSRSTRSAPLQLFFFLFLLACGGNTRPLKVLCVCVRTHMYVLFSCVRVLAVLTCVDTSSGRSQSGCFIDEF